jgi:hypothetical protein
MKEKRIANKEARKEMREENKMDRKEMRDEYKEKRFEMRMKYRKLINKRLGDKINKISDTKLEKVLVRIDSRITKIENNTKLSDSKKEKILAIL